MWATRIITSRKAATSTPCRERSEHRLGVCGSTCGYTGTALNANLYRPYQGWGAIALMEMWANSNYNSLQVALRVTAWKNLTLNSAYTWSHAFDIIDGEIFSNINNPFNARWDYGPAGFDRRHISVTSFIYQVPVLPELIQPGCQGGAGRMGTLRYRHLRVRHPVSHRRRPGQSRVGRRYRQPGEYRLARHLSGDPSAVVQHVIVPEAGPAPVGHFGQEHRGRPRDATTGTWRCSKRSSSPKEPGSSSGRRPSTPSTTRSSPIPARV